MTIDLEAFENYLVARASVQKFIPRNQLITADECWEISQFYNDKRIKNADIDAAFFPQQEDGEQFFVEISCAGEWDKNYEKIVRSGCGQKKNAYVTKTKFVDYLRNGNYICQDCEDKEKNRRKKESAEWHSSFEESKRTATKKYIETYLDPNKSWHDGVKIYQKWSYLTANPYNHIDWNQVGWYIDNMDYQEFLATPYWKAVSLYKKYKSKFKCNMCNSKEGLETHHRTYDTHGAEHLHLEDLIVLCHDCHAKFHDK